MCGIFGVISNKKINEKSLKTLVKHSKQRGKDSSGLIFIENSSYQINRADFDIDKLLHKVKPYKSTVVLGHSRLITNGQGDNQPVVRGRIAAIHNGIIVNESEVWSKLTVKRSLNIDSELIVAIAEEHLSHNKPIEELSQVIFSLCKGVIACAMVLPELGKLLLFSNNGSLYFGESDGRAYFASESYGLRLINCQNIVQIKGQAKILDIPNSDIDFTINDEKNRTENLIPELKFNCTEKSLLVYREHKIKRCTKCILPETMPFIKFDALGVCNYCNAYTPRNNPKPIGELFELIEPYRRNGNELDCIVPFSGGRDSCYGLHLIVKELKMKPVTYTYDWGMVTDLGRRNISRMCAQMGVENIIVAADISQKRRNIRMNLLAWLKSPHLGMMAMLTAGDKHFFRHVESIKKQTGINLNLWGVNPLEVTHFKTGFLDIEPDFEEKRVYSHGVTKQIRYHSKRFIAMLESPSYFNRSLFDTLSGEYFRSFTKKKDYYHLFDYWRWDENEVNNTLLNQYDWEKAIDTSTTWRIGDGTAAFYNYVYYTVAGFTEHDTFRSNQIREGQLSREKALDLVKDENQPRYQNIKWYLDTLGLDFEGVIKIVNAIPKIYKED
jgi:glucosamine--fructose-6-phosphate aminotransferase (isomerizing)